jgi:hypothetical protein
MGLGAAILGAGAIGAVGGIANGVMQSNAAGNAAKAQQNATNAALAEQQREFNIQQGNLQPWLASGRNALNQEDILLGLGGLSPDVLSGANITAAGSPGGMTDAQAQALLAARPDVMAEYQRASGAADKNSPAYLQQGLDSPLNYARYWYNNMGGNASYQIPSSITSGGATTPDAATQQQQAIDALKNSPLYKSLYFNGEQALLANASATGGLRGGNLETGLAQFGANTLADVYQNQIANLSNLSGLGANTGGVLGQLGGSTSSNISSLLQSLGAEQAGGITGSSALLGGGINSGLSSLLSSLGQYSTLGGFSMGLPQYTGIANMGAGTDVAGLF